MITLVTLFKGLKHVGLDLSTTHSYLLALAIGVVIAAAGGIYIRGIRPATDTEEARSQTVEKIFGVLMICTACAMAFAHGSNDVANAVGPVAAVVSVAQSGVIELESALPLWVLLVGGVGIVFGLSTYGWRVIRTIGQKITHLTPSRGFAAELAASTTIVVASGTGMPISTTHTLVGAVLGVGLAQSVSAIDLTVVRNIFVSWIVTVPAGAGLAIIFFFILKAIFG